MFGIAVTVAGGMVFMMSGGAAHTTAAESPRWQVTTEWHQFLRKSVRGTWFDIRSFGLSLKELTLELWPTAIQIKRVRQP